ncbi:MAG: multidrug transporter AcrB [Melioribacteraceae bacterium]|nr:MAG: multidrug transporter AcrB [Melioribacteraceae bacterium]
MEKIISYFVKYKVWTNVLMFSTFIFGLIALMGLRYSFFPEIRPDILNIQVVFPGASPEEVEEGVVLKVEEALEGLDDIERVTSISRENFGNITVEATKDSDLDKVLADVKNAVDGISSFPVGIEKPIISQQKFRTRALSVIVYGEADLYNLKFYADRIRDDLLATPEISQVQIDGVPSLEFAVEVSEATLRKYNLTFTSVANAVAAANLNISGGKFDTESEEVLIRAYGREYFAKDLSDVPVKTNRDGSVIYLSEIAEVKEQFEDVPDRVYYNGSPAAILNIDQTAQENILDVAAASKNLVETFNDNNIQVQALVLDDRTEPLSQRLDLLVKNGLFGLLLVIITLGFFLNLRLSFWVSIGIPFSFAGMFVVAVFSGITINVISLFGMIIVVGILVDDAIVVAENIFAHYEKGKPALKSAIDGAKEMVAPVTTSILTTVLAFMPFFFLDGTFGRFIWQMALVVVAALLFSLIEAFLILPAHLAHSKGLHPHTQDSGIRKKIEGIINFLTHKMYGPSLRLALKHKWITITLPVAMVFVTVGLLRGGFIGLTFFPFIDGDTLPVNISLVAGKQEAETDSILTFIEKKAWEVNEEMSAERADGRILFEGIKRDIGSNDFGEAGSHTGKVTIQLLEGEQRDMDSYIIANRLREKVGEIPEAMNMTFGRVGFFGKPVSVSLLGSDLNELERAKKLLFDELRDFSTLKDVTESAQEGRKELKVTLKPQAEALGLTLRDIAGQLRDGFFGREVQRIQRGIDEIRVWVRYVESDRSSLGFIDQYRIRTASGAEYPFSELAEYEIERGITVINHLDRKREIKVEANLADEKLDLPPILAEIQDEVLPRVLSQVEGVRASFEGQSRDQAKFQRSLQQVFPLAFIMMFILVILVFRSYMQAIIIFSLIPIGIVGAAWGHGIQGIQLNILSIYGIIALSGIIINDSIVFVDQINRNLRDGFKVNDAVFQAGLARLRPILLTTLTTSFGLAPLILETSRQAQFLIPMAVSVAYGLVFGTFILLIILPALYLVVNRIRVFVNRRILRNDVTFESVEPAVKELKLETNQA